MEKEKYITSLENFAKKNNISLSEYFKRLGEYYYLQNGIMQQDISKENPFLNDITIKSQEDVEQFRKNMLDMIEKYKSENLIDPGNIDFFEEDDLEKSVENFIDGEIIKKKKQDNKKAIDDFIKQELEREQDSRNVQISLSNIEIARILPGIKVRRIKGKVYVTSFKNAYDKNNVVSIYETISARDGDYINFVEYINELLDYIVNHYEKAEYILLLDKDGNELKYNDGLEQVYKKIREMGSLKLGLEYHNQELNTYKGLSKIITSSTIDFVGNRLTRGVYVNKDLLLNILSDYRFKIYSNKDDYFKNNSKNK